MDILKWVLLAAGAYVVLVILDQKAWDATAASCNSLCPVGKTYWGQQDSSSPIISNPNNQIAAPTYCNCPAYTQFQQQWGWLQPFIPNIEI